MPHPDAIEAAARAIIGDERYDALPARATYTQRKSSSGAEWFDREEILGTARAAIVAFEREAWIRVVDASADMHECLVGTDQAMVVGHVSHRPDGSKVASAPGYPGFEWPYVRALPRPPTQKET